MARLTNLKPRLKTLDSDKPRWGNVNYGKGWNKIRLEVFKRDGYICQVCLRAVINPECDHIIPNYIKEDNSMDNLQTICKYPCHFKKTQEEARDSKFGIKHEVE